MNINGVELDFKEVGAWPKQYRILLVVAACVLAFILGYIFFISSYLADLDNEKQQQVNLKDEFRLKFKQASNLEAFKNQINEIRSNFEISLKQLPSENKLAELIQQISNKAGEFGLSGLSIKPQNISSKDFYNELDISISTTGTYHSIGEFVNSVAFLPRIVTLHDFSLERASSSSPQAPSLGGNVFGTNAASDTGTLLKFDVTGRTYWYEPIQNVETNKANNTKQP